MANCVTLDIVDIPAGDVSITHIEILSTSETQATVNEAVTFRVELTNPTDAQLTRKSRLYKNGVSYSDSEPIDIPAASSVTIDYSHIFSQSDVGSYIICGESVTVDAPAPSTYPTVPGVGILCTGIPVVPVAVEGCAESDIVCKVIEWIRQHPLETGLSIVGSLAFIIIVGRDSKEKKKKPSRTFR